MFMDKSSALIAVLLALLPSACQREELPSRPTEPPAAYSTISVMVRLCDFSEDPFCEATTPIAGANVRIFASEKDLQFGEPVLFQKTTGGDGNARFDQLEGGRYYYLETQASQGIQASIESTPNNGIAYHEVLYFE